MYCASTSGWPVHQTNAAGHTVQSGHTRLGIDPPTVEQPVIPRIKYSAVYLSLKYTVNQRKHALSI